MKSILKATLHIEDFDTHGCQEIVLEHLDSHIKPYVVISKLSGHPMVTCSTKEEALGIIEVYPQFYDLVEVQGPTLRQILMEVLERQP